jgi:hypothetical protein
MRPVVYFPELQIHNAVVPAHVALGVDAPRLDAAVTPLPDSALTGASERLESASTLRPSRRQPAVPASTIEV